MTGHPETLAAPPWTKQQRFALILVVALGIALGWLGRRTALTTGGDEATYILLSHSLAQGHYRDLFYPGHPAHAQYPPGWPAWILLAQTLLGTNLDVLRALNLMLIAVAALTIGDALRRLTSREVGVAGAAAVMLNPALLYWGGWILSESLYVACAALTLWLLLRSGQDRPGRLSVTLALLIALLGFFTRTVGLALVGTTLFTLAWQRRWKETAIGGAFSLVVIGAWFRYTAITGQETVGWTYANDLQYIERNRGLMALLTHAFGNTKLYVLTIGTTLFGVPDIQGTAIDNAIWAVPILVLIIAGLWTLFRRWTGALTFLLLTFGILLVFPFALPRLAAPLVPWLITAMALGSLALGRRLGLANPGLAAIAVLATVASIGVVSDARSAVKQQECRGGDPYAHRECFKDEDRWFIAGVRWVGDHLPADAVVATSKPSAVNLLTDRLTMPADLLIRRDPGELLAPRGPVTHILLTGLMASEREAIPWALEPVCRRLALLARPDSATIVLGVVPSTDSAGPGACQALRDYRIAPTTDFDTSPR